VVAAGAAVLVEFLDRLAEPLKRRIVVERALHEPDALRELVPDRLIKRGPCVGLDGVLHLRGEVLVVPVPPAETDQREAGRQQAAVGQVIHGGHELFAGKVPRDSEEHKRGRSGNPVQPPVPRIPQGIPGPGR
jgi:hypothetical protein